MSTLGEILEVARRAAGITQEDLVEQLGITQAALSRYENGQREPDVETLARIASVLGVTPAFLTHSAKFRGAMAVDVHMRRQKSEKPRVWRRLEAQLNMHRLHASLLFEEVSVRAEQSVPVFDPIDVTPAAAARMVRMQWRMPVGPVRALIQWLEAAGCLVLVEDFGTARVDGLSQWVDDHPVILVNSGTPTDRKRWTLAHELGHLCLHVTSVSEDMETEANQFAAEFLMPEVVIRPQLRKVTVPRLADLKREWGTSMQALIERAHGLKLITLQERTGFYKRLSALGWRTQEPLSDQLPTEQVILTGKIADAMRGRGLDEEQVAHKAGFASSKQNRLFVPSSRRLQAV